MSSAESELRDVWGETSARSRTRKKSGIRYTSDGSVYKADPSNAIDKFESIDAREDTFGNELPELELPGFGEAYDDCGDDIPRFCADCGHTHTVGRTCYRSTCPRCANGWARNRATTAAAKLEATRRYEESTREGWSGYKFHHITASPPPGYATFSNEALDRTFETLKEVLGELGADAGVMFYHPFRGDNEDREGDDRGKWQERLFNNRDWENDVRDELKFSPHFHCVVVGKYIDGAHVTRAIESNTGWLIHRITKGDSDVSIYDKYDLARVTSYCLSHTGLQEKEETTRAAYRYFGRTHNLTPTDAIEAEMDAAVRSVAPKTLDIGWSDLACTEDRDGRESQTPLVASTQAAYESPDGEGEYNADDKDAPDGTCAGRLLNINKAPAFLNDDEWCKNAPHADELAEVYDEWHDEIEPPPD